MKKILKAAFVLAFMGIGVLTFSAAATATTSPVDENSAATAESAIQVKTLYTRNCARCHGADGKSQTELGQTMDAPDLTGHKMSVKHNIQIITNGEGAMPGFGKKLKKADIAALANYVRTL